MTKTLELGYLRQWKKYLLCFFSSSVSFFPSEKTAFLGGAPRTLCSIPGCLYPKNRAV